MPGKTMYSTDGEWFKNGHAISTLFLLSSNPTAHVDTFQPVKEM